MHSAKNARNAIPSQSFRMNRKEPSMQGEVSERLREALRGVNVAHNGGAAL